uniref:Helicase C-terminal domain-containing protein n=1 Tax=Chromera velia CCMP2878 TaxID=1169474 RepID=A0A0G4HZ21_9ALVE|eukprot:Cvel_9612.t1-p1 / transcript=Cvel_9612.t1 / gene=Cvel_9612 / organism=Chromera_velia_CCMP2878 / gene_product=Superkiller viralicidic activity 2-like 2, putative / transcript_product=Superkiller viralicidic activity 2-like 2, putative / location=Cvel_scaffold558:57041-66317(+) / protein_length=1121 / sequence_SO=supercontig / SO=protein_coding / is_pseudo=false
MDLDVFDAFDEEKAEEVVAESRKRASGDAEGDGAGEGGDGEMGEEEDPQKKTKKTKRIDDMLQKEIEAAAEEMEDPFSGDQDTYDVEFETFSTDGTNCAHECIKPRGWTRKPRPTGPPAKEYKFTLDAFQQAAVGALEIQESVLVSAHTSAGKTVVAEYAISMALRDKQRVIYTSPIKALSNQKFRDLSEEYKDVGLMTGDVTLNHNASVMVMTTEILRSMLYRGSELCREMAWVIFDEIHYMRDRDRGVVWEETIILLPDAVRLVFLSATIPNSKEFAEWICRTKHQPCHLVFTDYRPTPLQHYLFPCGGEGLFLVYDEKKNFHEDNFSKAVTALQQGVEDMQLAGKGTKSKEMNRLKSQKMRTKNDVEKILSMTKRRGYLPVIVFSFSKRDVESNAMGMKGLDLTSEEEKETINMIWQNALGTLADEDKELPQLEAVKPLLLQGFGMHHGGLLPIVKEVTEILFGESLIKVLFATETFAMGINMPAKTVVFTDIRKWDGVERRTVTSGEYIQMSGRAGRRGLDDRGISILMLNERVEPDVAKAIFTGEPTRIDSAFKLSFNMLLNLLRVEGADPHYMIARSFHQFQRFKRAVTLKEEHRKATLAVEEFGMPREICEREAREAGEAAPEWPKKVDVNEAVADYTACRFEILERIAKGIRDIVFRPEHSARFLTPGRAVSVRLPGRPLFGWGLVLNATRTLNKDEKLQRLHREQKARGRGYDPVAEDAAMEQVTMIVDILLCVKSGSGAPSSDEDLKKVETPFGNPAAFQGGAAPPLYQIEPGDMSDALGSKLIVVPCCLDVLDRISKMKIDKMDQQWDLRSEEKRTSFQLLLSDAWSNASTHPEANLLDPKTDMRINSPKLDALLEERNRLMDRMSQNPLKSHPLFDRLLVHQQHKIELEMRKLHTQKELQEHTHLVMKDDLRGMKRVLRRLEYVGPDGKVITLKGRIACEVTTAAELVMGEMLFQNLFETLSPDRLVALLSAAVYDEGKLDDEEEEPPEDPELAEAFEVLKGVAEKVVDAYIEASMPYKKEEFVAMFRPAMMNFCMGWCAGKKFGELMVAHGKKMFEGSVIRTLRRLEELMRQLAAASRGIGNEQLEQKFLAGIALLKRGIVFAASLYL